MRSLLVTAIASFALVVACGSSHPLAAQGGAPGTSAGAGDTDTASDGDKPPGCGVASDGTTCGCTDVPLFVDPPNMYFVLDHSASMADAGKWDQVRTTITNLTRQIGQRARFGATIFPSLANVDQCQPGAEVMSLRDGDPPSSSKDGPTTTALLSAMYPKPSGGTPTASTLRDVLGRVRSFQGKTFIILATDGGPNCNESANCTSAGCMANIENASSACTPNGPNCCTGAEAANCLDAQPTTEAVRALQQAGFPVYVIGIPGSAPYASLLDDLAVAGGTAQSTSPKYYRVDTVSSASLLGALRQVAAKIVATCTFELKDSPPDPNYVNVYLDEVVLPREPTNGWTLDGKTVTLEGSACARVMNGDVLDVRIIAGCPSILH